jgi:hypothetical protein
MSFYVRKSFQRGPFRLNFSKSGVGVSVGVPGFRVGIGPRGTYFHAGRQSVYYRSRYYSPQWVSGSNTGLAATVEAQRWLAWHRGWYGQIVAWVEAHSNEDRPLQTLWAAHREWVEAVTYLPAEEQGLLHEYAAAIGKVGHELRWAAWHQDWLCQITSHTQGRVLSWVDAHPDQEQRAVEQLGEASREWVDAATLAAAEMPGLREYATACGEILTRLIWKPASYTREQVVAHLASTTGRNQQSLDQMDDDDLRDLFCRVTGTRRVAQGDTANQEDSDTPSER